MGKVLRDQAARSVACAAWVIALAACGGGGGGGGGIPMTAAAPPAAEVPSASPAAAPLPPLAPSTPLGPATTDEALATPSTTGPEDKIVASKDVVAQCAAPRSGTDPSTNEAFVDKQGTVDSEKRWVRAWIDKTYLWFDEVPTTFLAKASATPVDYFNVLKTPKLTARGRPKDRFHFTADTEAVRILSQSGIELGYGMELAFLSASPPRDIRVAFTEPDSLAAARMARGDRLIGIDGKDVVNGTDVAALNAGLSPQREGESHSFTLRANDGAERTVTFTSAKITHLPVRVWGYETSTGRVGYMLFNDHLATAEIALADWMAALKDYGISDLVIDVRYNGGGYLAIASQLAYMVSSSDVTSDKVFERLQFSKKNPFEQKVVPFISRTLGFSAAAGQALPQLGLKRVTVLTGPDTCSASESLINGLRGVGVQVATSSAAPLVGSPMASILKTTAAPPITRFNFRASTRWGLWRLQRWLSAEVRRAGRSHA